MIRTSSLKRIYDRLFAAFGPQHWWPGDSALEIAVGAILTQNAAWANVERAIASLKERRLLHLRRLSRISPDRLAPLIKPAGLYNVKAIRLHALIQWLNSRGGFARLRRLPTAELRQDLLACHGIGPETADSTLLYALGRPVFVIDAYTRRILGRYGIARGDEPYEHLRRLFETNLEPDPRLFNEFHALFVRLAKSHCRVRPVCAGCPLEHG